MQRKTTPEKIREKTITKDELLNATDQDLAAVSKQEIFDSIKKMIGLAPKISLLETCQNANTQLGKRIAQEDTHSFLIFSIPKDKNVAQDIGNYLVELKELQKKNNADIEAFRNNGSFINNNASTINSIKQQKPEITPNSENHATFINFH